MHCSGGHWRQGVDVGSHLQRELPPLASTPFVCRPGDLRVKDVRTVALHMSYRIGNGAQVHPLNTVGASNPNGMHYKMPVRGTNEKIV